MQMSDTFEGFPVNDSAWIVEDATCPCPFLYLNISGFLFGGASALVAVSILLCAWLWTGTTEVLSLCVYG